MSYHRGYDDDDRGYGGYGDAPYRSRHESDFRDRDRYGGYGDREDRDRRRRDSGYDRRESAYDRRDSGFDRRRESGYDRRESSYDRREGGGRHGGGGYGGRSGQGDRKRQFGGKGGGSYSRENGGRGSRGGKRSFGGRDSGGDSKRQKMEMEDNWISSDRHPVMESHFLDTVPPQFKENWLCVVCPAGKRRILVAANNKTQTYNNEGEPDLTFKSCLPNGSPLQNEVMKYQDLTILDTVFCSQKKKIYIIDMLHWKHFPYYESEAEFRSFFLPEKYSELKKPMDVTENNEYPLVLLDKISCSEANIAQALKDTEYKVEGLLFIKKTSTYECTDSTDSLLLRLDQMEKVLGVPVREGLSFTQTSAEDTKWREELEERKKLRAVREAAKLAQEKEKAKEKAKEKEEEEKQVVDTTTEIEPTTTDYATGDTTGEEYATAGDYNTGGEYTAEAEYTTAGAEYSEGGEYTTGATFVEGWGQAGVDQGYYN